MLKNLKSLFVVEEEVPAKGNAKAKAPASTGTDPSPTPATSPSVSPAATPAAREGKVTQKFTDILLKAMDQADLDGFDYLEYKKSLKSLRKMNMIEETAYQSAYAMAQTMGATPDHLVKTAEHYLRALTEEEKKFEAALVNQRDSRVGTKRQEQQRLAKTIQDKEAQIKKLQAEIQQHRQKLGKLDGEIKNADTSIANTQNDFFASYQNLVRQIQEDITKMKQYLK